MVHFLVIRLRLTLEVDDENGCDRGEQTSLESTQGLGVCGKMSTKIGVVFKGVDNTLSMTPPRLKTE